MGVEIPDDWRAAAASALEWWADAGVDLLVEEEPRDWLAVPARPITIAEPTAAPDALPDRWEAFAAWRVGAEAPEAAWRGTHLAASGPADARVMVLLDCPDRDDAEEDRLLGGTAGRLFDRMLAAIGLTRDAVHLASVCGKRPVAGRTPREDEARLAAIAQHHVALVAPRRLLLLGDAATRAVLATNTQAARGSLHPFAANGGATEIVASFHPRFLLENARAKAEAWKDLQLLIGGLNP